MSLPVAVIGAGLSGLHASGLLQQAGQRVLLIEARERIGGRVLSQGSAGAGHRADLGPSWFWPAMNPRMRQLVTQLGLRHYRQSTRGALMLEGADGQVRRHPGTWGQEPASHRIQGGMQTLVEALHARLDEAVHLALNTRLVALGTRAQAVELTLEDARGRWTQTVSRVIVAIAPRLLAQDVALDPPWPADLLADMTATPTWMAGQAKFVVAYPTPFWRDAGLSGSAMSHRGPLSEVHDACDEAGEVAALFGFVGVPHDYRAGMGRDELVRQSVAQLARLFGPQAAAPLWSVVQDWAQEPLTATRADQRPLGHHPMYQAASVPAEGGQRVWLAGAERSPNHGGYLEGALEAAELAVAGLLQSLTDQVKAVHPHQAS